MTVSAIVDNRLGVDVSVFIIDIESNKVEHIYVPSSLSVHTPIAKGESCEAVGNMRFLILACDNSGHIVYKDSFEAKQLWKNRQIVLLSQDSIPR